MNKENKVTSLKLSKKIHDKAKEKGFELPESNWYWGSDKKLYYRFDKSMIDFDQQILIKKSYFNDDFEWCQAYDIAELGEMLPSEIAVKELICKINIEKTNHWTVRYGIYAFGQLLKTIHCEGADTEAEARGLMYFYLLDNNLL